MQKLVRAVVSALMITLGLLLTAAMTSAFAVFFLGFEWNTRWSAETTQVVLLASGGIFGACVVIFLFSGRK